MGIFSKNSSKYNGELVAVFDIGSASVGGALFYMKDSGIPEIIFSTRENIVSKKHPKINNFSKEIIKALDSVAKQIMLSPAGAPKKFFCILASPYYVSQNRIISINKNTPFVFNDAFANKLISQEIKLFKEEHLENNTNDKNKLRIIELKNIQIKLNGYEVEDPLGQKGKELEMTLFISMSEESFLSKIEKIILKHFHTKEIKFSSFTIASFTAVRDTYMKQSDFLLMDIGGEVTDISMIKKNILRESVSYPIGTNYMIRSMASMLGNTFDEAKSFFSLYKNKHAHTQVQDKIDPIVDKIRNQWLKKFQSSLANLSNDISIPSTIFFSVEESFALFFIETIKTEQFNQYTLAESKFKVIFLNTEILHGMATFKDDIIRDSFLIIEAAYINRFLK